ncbi:uncharacterized protein LOC112602477 [Melanaphis sacchari]|uniref:uncharacterized protein LOC112602477 n=1 Tax=Melanaphis sacchari TaxID=742174 RepID=UPI000DC141F0|nr:uncharacterized protein LOC112602477 [Melanaphis sacchari]
MKQFFGIARQVSGPNDHPCSSTFLQIYKTLSVYSILRPPKTGNCKILDSGTPKITIDDLKNVFNNDTTERTNKINLLKQKLDMLVVQETEIDIVFDTSIHSYFKAETKDCVIYYICGYITKNYTKRITCELCRKALIDSKNYSDKPEATLVNLKTKGGLIHPNEFVFKILSAVEDSFSKFCDSNDVFELTLNNFFEEYGPIKFPCADHKTEILKFILSDYIVMRMRQYTLVMNKNQNKNNAKKKKHSKLVNT